MNGIVGEIIIFGGFIVVTLALNWIFRWRHHRPSRSDPDFTNPWMPSDQGSHGHRHGSQGGGGGHHHGWGGGGDGGGGHHGGGGWSGGSDGGSVGGHHG
jgi:hypothetical protein